MTTKAKRGKPSSDSDSEWQRIVVRGVRTETGHVQLLSLVDGWAVVPDYFYWHRMLGKIGVSAFVGIFVGAPLLKTRLHDVGIAISATCFIIAILAMALDRYAVSIIARRKARTRRNAARQRVGDWSIDWALRAGSTSAKTCAAMTVHLAALGVDDTVIPAKSVRHARLRHSTITTSATVELNSDQTVNYRVHGLRAPHRLATLIANPLGPKCTTP